MDTSRWIALALLLAVPFLSACAANKPRVAVERGAWTERTDEAAVLDIGLAVSNPGRAPLEVREVRYLVTQGGRQIYHGRRSVAQTIAPGGSVQLTVPAVVPAEDVAAVGAAGAVAFTGSMVYITPGRLALVMRDLGLPPLRRDFTGEAALGPQ